MVVIERYVRKMCGRTKPVSQWFSLVRCDDCGKEKMTVLSDTKRHDMRYCDSCREKGERNHNFGKHPSAETLFKLSGRNHRGFGKPLSPLTKMKISLAHKGRFAGKKHRNFGKHLSETTRQRISEAQKGKVISDEQKKQISETLTGRYRGPESPHWKPNLTPQDREKRRFVDRPAFLEWRKQVYRRDHGTCQISGVRAECLHAHHLFNWDLYPEKRFDINNGIIIDRTLHQIFHHIYGIKNNTPEQFWEFCEYMHEALNP